MIKFLIGIFVGVNIGFIMHGILSISILSISKESDERATKAILTERSINTPEQEYKRPILKLVKPITK